MRVTGRDRQDHGNGQQAKSNKSVHDRLFYSVITPGDNKA
jgi:hypothetical protein